MIFLPAEASVETSSPAIQPTAGGMNLSHKRRPAGLQCGPPPASDLDRAGSSLRLPRPPCARRQILLMEGLPHQHFDNSLPTHVEILCCLIEFPQRARRHVHSYALNWLNYAALALEETGNSVVRVTPRAAASVMLKPKGSMHWRRTKPPEWGGFFIGICSGSFQW